MAVITGFPLDTVARMMRFLDGRPLAHLQFNPEVATRHHDAVGGGYDAVEVVHAIAVFNFGDDRNVGAELLQLPAQRADFAGVADK